MKQFFNKLKNNKNLHLELSKDLGRRVISCIPQISSMTSDKGGSIGSQLKTIAEKIYNVSGIKTFYKLSTHRSEFIRGIGCFLIVQSSLDFQTSLKKLDPLIKDPHCAVRRWAKSCLENILTRELATGKSSWETINQDKSDREPLLEKSSLSFQFQPKKISRKAFSPLVELDVISDKAVQKTFSDWLSLVEKNKFQWLVNITDIWTNFAASRYTKQILEKTLKQFN